MWKMCIVQRATRDRSLRQGLEHAAMDEVTFGGFIMKKFLSITLCIVITAFLILTLTSCGKRNSMVHYNSTLADYEDDILEQLGFSDNEDAVQGFDVIYDESTFVYDMIESNTEWDDTVELSNIRFWYDGDREVHGLEDFEFDTEYVFELSEQTETYLTSKGEEHTVFAGNQIGIRFDARDITDDFDSTEFKMMHTKVDGYYISVGAGYIVLIDPNARDDIFVTLSGKNAWEIFKDMSWQVVNKKNENADALKSFLNPILENFGIRWH